MKPTIQSYTQAEELRQVIEREVLEIIQKLSETEGVTKEKIQEIAKRTLKLARVGMTLDELYQSAVKLDDNCSELAPVVVTIMRAYEEKYAKKALSQVSQLVKDHQFDEAQDVVKKVLQYKSIS